MKKILMIMAALAMTGAAFAQYDDFSYEENSEPAITINGEAGVKGRAWLGHTDQKNIIQRDPKDLSTWGQALKDSNGNEILEDYWRNGFSGKKDIRNAEMATSAYGKLEFNYNGSSSDVNVKFHIDTSEIKDYPEDILEEATARGYFGNWVVSAGKMKVVWGKGDKLHVLDNFNANNYTDFIFPDYIERRLAEPMLSVAYSVPNATNLRFEGIVTPKMTADRFAESGILVPYAQKKLTNTVTGIVTNNLVNSVSKNLDPTPNSAGLVAGIMGASSFTSDSLYSDNLNSLKFAQAGARMTGTIGSVDFGFSYYYGHYKQPSANLENYIYSVLKAAASDKLPEVAAEKAKLVSYGLPSELANIKAVQTIGNKYAEEYTGNAVKAVNGEHLYDLPSLTYDRLQVFGVEAATVIWKFNTRAEFAYNLTEDTAGTNPWIHNNSIGWVGGFDMDIPVHNLNINVQENGVLVLKKDKIKNGDFKAYDVDYNSDDKYCINKIVTNISDKFFNEKLTTECTTIYGIENKEWCIQPKIEYNPIDGLFFTLSGAYLYSNNENGEFYNFTSSATRHHRLSYAQLAVKYSF